MKLSIIVGSKKTVIEVTDVTEASKKYQEFRDENNLGSSRLEFGRVLEDEKLIARISYNGRVWNLDGTIRQEATK